MCQACCTDVEARIAEIGRRFTRGCNPSCLESRFLRLDKSLEGRSSRRVLHYLERELASFAGADGIFPAAAWPNAAYESL